MDLNTLAVGMLVVRAGEVAKVVQMAPLQIQVRWNGTGDREWLDRGDVASTFKLVERRAAARRAA